MKIIKKIQKYSKKGRKLLKSGGFVLLLLLISLSYSFLRFSLNTEYSGATWQSMYDLNAQLPFGYRILIPVLCRPLVEWFSLPVRAAYFFFEALSCIFVVIALKKIFQIYLEEQHANVYALAIFLFLPFLYLFNFMWPLYYPYDTAAIAFIAWSIYLIIKERWVILVFVTALGTLNRETTLLIPLTFLALAGARMEVKRAMSIFTCLITAYVAVRCAVSVLVANNPTRYYGPVAFAFEKSWRALNNLNWLLEIQNWFILLATTGFMLVLWLLLRSNIPRHLRRLHLVAFSHFSLLIFVGNLYEPRMFGEMFVILYFPFCLGLNNYLTGKKVQTPRLLRKHETGVLAPLLKWLDKWGLLLLLIGIIIIVLILSRMTPEAILEVVMSRMGAV